MGRTGKAIPPARSKRAMHLAGSPIYDSVVADLKFDPTVVPDLLRVPLVVTPKTVAKRVRRKQPVSV